MLQRILHDMEVLWIMVHGLSSFASNLRSRGGSNTKLGDHETLKSHNPPSNDCVVWQG